LPPRRFKLEPNVVVIIPAYIVPLDVNVIDDWIRGWQDAGANVISFRPNLHYKYLGGSMPIGVEKQMFDVFQTAYRHGAVAMDYDALRGEWVLSGISDYILAHGFIDPSKPFEYWEKQYCQAFGAAEEDVRKYFRYWREELWDKRLLPAMPEIIQRGGSGSFVRGMMWSLGKYYTEKDFDETDRILERAEARKLTALQRDRVEQLVIANRHARLVYEAVAAPLPDKYEHTKKLLAFRNKYKNISQMPLDNFSAEEINMGDITGIELAENMQDYLRPWLETDLIWKFKLDQNNAGDKEKWYQYKWSTLSGWESIRTDKTWENQSDEEKLLTSATRKIIGNYDGIGWYAVRVKVPEKWNDGRKIFLRFGAVDESCWVYLNGKYAGRHLYEKSSDWKTPFEIQIDKLINWGNERQVVVVRVEDVSGGGGIWKRVWLVSRK
jgi:hypothetical protein